MPVIQSLLDDLKAIEELHRRKNDDYANDANPFLNFDQCSEVLSWFKNPEDLAFVWPIANKLSRLANLLSDGRTPNNESIDDSLLDIATYVLLWKADIKRRNQPAQQLVCNQCGNKTTAITHELFFDKTFVSKLSFCSDVCAQKYRSADLSLQYELYSIFGKKNGMAQFGR